MFLLKLIYVWVEAHSPENSLAPGDVRD